MAKWILFSTVFNIILGSAFAGNNFTYTGTPVPGEPFTITWTPDTYATVDILLNHLTGYPYYVPTTSVPIVEGIANTGSYVWNVPTNIDGFLSLSIARDANFPVSFSPMFIIGPYTSSSVPPVTSVPQSTACTSAVPQATGVNPFLIPDQSSVLRVGIATNIQWQPTSGNTVSLILNPEESEDETIASAAIIRNISNSGMFTWTPPNDSVLLSAGGWFLTLVDDVTQETSQSDGFNVLPADYLNSFTGPYPPPVLGQDHTFYWSPSTNPTISILIIKAVPYSTVNMTIADHVPNTGSFKWSVPSSDPIIIPGIWDFSLINDLTGNADSKIEIAIDATTPALCGPQTSVGLSSLLASFRGTTTSFSNIAPTTTNLTALSLLESFSSARAATITKITPSVLVTATTAKTAETAETATGAGSTTGSGPDFESQSTGSKPVVTSTSTAGAMATGVNGRWTRDGGYLRGLELPMVMVGFLGGFMNVL